MERRLSSTTCQMSTCVIHAWTGRTGNNVLQIARCLFYAETHGYSRIQFPAHRILSTTEIRLDQPAPRTASPVIDTFFYLDRLGVAEPPVVVYRRLAQKYIIPILKIPVNLIRPRPDTELLIHVRSGDIFQEAKPHPAYVQPPLWFYDSAMTEGAYTSALVVYEDTANPCVPELIRRWPSQTNPERMEKDLATLLSGRAVAVGYGTFGLLVYMLSRNLRCLYVPDYAVAGIYSGLGASGDVEIRVITLPDYIRPGEWKNTEVQRRTMITYSVATATAAAAAAVTV